jgi:hypothetical protein
MSEQEMMERDLQVDDKGRIIDQFGNEYRDENGYVCYLKKGNIK